MRIVQFCYLYNDKTINKASLLPRCAPPSIEGCKRLLTTKKNVYCHIFLNDNEYNDIYFIMHQQMTLSSLRWFTPDMYIALGLFQVKNSAAGFLWLFFSFFPPENCKESKFR